MGQAHAYTCTMLPKSRMGSNECTGKLALTDGCAGAMRGLNGRAMDRRGEVVRSAVCCRPGRHVARVVLPSILRRAGEAAHVRGDLCDLRRRPTGEKSV